MDRRWLVATAVIAAGLTMVACSGSSADDATPTSQVQESSTETDTEDETETEDELAPLVITSLAPDPIPFTGSDGKVHVAYELSVLNFAPNPAVITLLETLDPDGNVVASLSQDEVAARAMIIPELSMAGMPDEGIPAGRTALLLLDDVYPDRGSVPSAVTHRVTATFTPTVPDEGYAALWPASVVQETAPVAVSSAEPLVVGAPVSGDGWLAASSCCDLNAHRFVMFPVAGGINGGERFAIDFMGVDPAGVVAPTSAADVFHPGSDGSRNEDFLGYGASVLAVDDATVVHVVDSVADTPPGGTPNAQGLSVNSLGGNEIVLRLGPDLYAFYLHLAPDSITVKQGDTVKKGQEIARLGNSGNSSGAHLHFQLGDSPRFLTARNIPYVFEEFTLVGTLADSGLVESPTPGPRTDALPLGSNIVDFP